MIKINDNSEYEESVSLLQKTKYSYIPDVNSKKPETEDDKNMFAYLSKYFDGNFYQWQGKSIEDIMFTLPKTIFREDSKINYQSHKESELEYGESVEHYISAKQFSEIWEKGEFSVNSKIADLSYVWKISEWILKGTSGIKKTFDSDLSSVFYFLYAIKFRFNFKFKLFNMFASIKYFFTTFVEIFDLFFGRTTYNFQSIGDAQNEVQKNYFLAIYKEFPKMDYGIYLSR